LRLGTIDMKAILYELNEVPWRVFDHYVARHPRSAFAELGREAVSFTTLTHDVGELHPWTTWPSLHRGVYNSDHHITFINQAIDTKYKPVWELLAEHGNRVGVFGSLQSHGLFPRDLGQYDFYVPDTFAPTSRTHPVDYEPFQRFNLRMTTRDGAAAQAGVPVDGQVARDGWGMLRTGLSARSMAAIAKQLVDERMDPAYRTRRSVLQAPLAFDAFLHVYERTQPDFATFFTNHVAGMMHRYWRHTFPEDFSGTEQPADAVRASNIDFAMSVADAQLARLLRICRERDVLLIVASSMGQEAIDRGEYGGELRIIDGERFARALGFTGPVRANLAMQPDFAFAFDSLEDRDAFRALVERVRDEAGRPLFLFKASGPTLNINLQQSSHCAKNDCVYLAQADGGLERRDASGLGMKPLFRDEGTGYHQPRGTLFFHQRSLSPNRSRDEVELSRVLPTILACFGVPAPAHCQAALPI
jgi:hypothetical protein